MSAKTISLDTKQGGVTPQEVMQMETFKHLTEEEAKEVIQVFDTFCGILYSFWLKQQPKPKRKPTTISFQQIPQQKAA